eukprot:scaffold168174_cov48-Attheya_sp.AAC.1
MSTDVYRCLQIDVYRCLQMSTDVYRCLQMSTDVYRCLQNIPYITALMISRQFESRLTRQTVEV